MWTGIFCLIWVCLSYSPSVTAQGAPEAGSKINIFLTNWEPSRLLRISEDGNQVWAARIRTYLRRPTAIDFDPGAAHIYVTDIISRRIYRLGVDAGGRTAVVTLNKTAIPDGLVADSINQKLFYTDPGNDIIASTNFDGKQHEILYSRSDGLSQPRAIIADTSNRRIFWTDWGDEPYIAMGTYDGTNMTKIITKDLEWPNGLALDAKNNILFWCDARTDKVESSSVNGSNRKVLFHERKRLSHFFDIAFHEGTLYFTDWSKRAVLAMSSNGGPVRNISSSLITKPACLHVVSGKIRGDCSPGQYKSLSSKICEPCGHCNSSKICNPLTGFCPNGCEIGYRGSTCKLECSFNRYGVRCAQYCGYCRPGERCDKVSGHCPNGCNTGWKGLKCDEQDGEPDITIFVGSISPGRLLSVSKLDDHVWTTRINVSLLRPVAIDYDPVEKEIYWTDITRIGKTDLKGNKEILLQLSSFSSADGLALDIGTRKLFFSDSRKATIGTMFMNGTSTKIILRSLDDLDKPRAIILDPRNREFFWTDWGSNPYIASANYDGTNMTKIITKGLTKPFGLTLDTRNKVLYWCDATTGNIEQSWINGSHRRTLYYDPTAHFFDIEFYNGFLYFTDWNTRGILILPAVGGQLQNFSSPLLNRASGLSILPSVNTVCEPGAYGKYCQYFCDKCVSGICDFMTGRCADGCLPGWRGDDCKTACPPKTYGPCLDCGHCAGGGQCDNVSGNCPDGCQLGWKGDRCDIKCYMAYDQSCVACGHCLHEKPCDERTGHCPNGCEIGWTGPLCKIRFSVPVRTQPISVKSTGDKTAVIAGAVGGSLGLLLIIITVAVVAAVIFARRMKLHNASRQTNEEDFRQPRDFNSSLSLPPPYASNDMAGVRYVTSADDAVLVTNQEDGQSIMNEGENGASSLPEKDPRPE